MRKYYIGLDVHCAFTEMAVVSAMGKLVERRRCATNVSAVWKALKEVSGELHVVMEEGPLADWLWRNLHQRVKELTVCEPRRNHLIAKDSDKDDAIDAEKLANLFRGGFVKAVHHPQSLERTLLKQQVMLYHDRVRGRVREAKMMQKENPFFEQYRRWSEAGLSFKNARRNVARSQASVLWGMWKNGSDNDPARVGVAAAEREEPVSV